MTDQTTTPTRPPRWADYAPTVRNEDYLTALELLDLSPAVASWCAAAGGLRWTGRHVETDRGTLPDCDVDWDAAAEQLNAGTYLSGTEARLAGVVLALTAGRRVDLRDLTLLGSWTEPVWAILERWRLL